MIRTAGGAASRARREVVCDKCGASAPALKTCRRRDGEGKGVLCTSCWLVLRERVWVVPGRVNVWGRCRVCARWESINDLSDTKPGYPIQGVCVDCATVEALVGEALD
jgi:hypothetical protein